MPVSGVRARLGRAFPPDRSGTADFATVLRYLAGIIAATLIVLLRQPGVPALDTIWAEDGSVFLADAVNRSFLDVVLTPYAGYAHLVPRLLAELASHLPLGLAAWVLSGGSALVLASLAAFVYRVSACIEHWPLRLALASSLVLLPAAIVEALANAANLHWFLIFAAFWALLWVPRGTTGRFVAALVVTLAALSDPLTLLLAPVAIARFVALRGWRDHTVTIAWAVALAVQLTVVIESDSRTVAGADVVELAALYGARVVGINLVGLQFGERLWPTIGGVLPWLGLGLVIAFTVYVLTRPNSRTMLPGALAITTSVLLFAVGHWVQGAEDVAVGVWGLPAARYLIVPTLALLCALMLVLDDRDPRVGKRRWSAVRSGVLVWYVAVVAMSLSVSNGREGGPSWQDALAEARAACPTADGTAILQITPQTWVIRINCRAIGDDVGIEMLLGRRAAISSGRLSQPQAR